MAVSELYVNEEGITNFAHAARTERDLSCFKCDSNRHTSISCPYAEIGFQAARKARIRRDGEESDEDTKSYLPPRQHNGKGKTRKVRYPASPERSNKPSSSAN
ncbi:Bgt-20021 [Blumeria graminis f. sp. tritici]|uniref:Bgt-20021 n=2 Tax=Blumeria graminis f. sp. tritici TaxID=62690 RepID=A0A381LCH9_BLUGR|nr:Bgt-20021 [Blumeria graminis f. sp. tritici]